MPRIRWCAVLAGVGASSDERARVRLATGPVATTGLSRSGSWHRGLVAPDFVIGAAGDADKDHAL
jgi:hypothetical protein